MGKEKIMLPIGSREALVFEADPASKTDQDFAKLCGEAAATKPESIQEFFIRLNSLQKKKTPERRKKKGRKM